MNIDTAADTPATPCTVCQHGLHDDERGTCRPCTGKARTDLHAIVNLYAMLPDILTNTLGSNAPRPDPSRCSERPMPGGPALVLLAGGSDAANRRRDWLANPQRDPTWDQDDQPGDPPSVAHELARWEDEFRRARHEPASPSRPYVATAVAYLIDRLGWAASRHPEFGDFATDLRRIRRTLERATGTLDQPLRADAPCFDCGGTLQRHYRDRTGLDDDWTCSRCHRTYTEPAYYLAVRAKLEADQAAP